MTTIKYVKQSGNFFVLLNYFSVLEFFQVLLPLLTDKDIMCTLEKPIMLNRYDVNKNSQLYEQERLIKLLSCWLLLVTELTRLENKPKAALILHPKKKRERKYSSSILTNILIFIKKL